MPNLRDPFSYLFWLDFDGRLNDGDVQEALRELAYFTKQYTVI